MKRGAFLREREEVVGDVLPACGQRRCCHESERHERDPRIFHAAHADDHGRAHAQRDGGEQLIRDAEHGPDRANRSGENEIAPREHDEQARDDGAGHPIGLFERLVNFAERFLHEKARDARAGIDRGENEQGLEHDGEVIPIRHQTFHAGQGRENLRDADGQ